MSYVIECAPDIENADYIPYGGNEDMIYAHDPEVIVSGPAECLAGETLIFDPLMGQARSIEWFYKNKIAPHVMTLYGTKKATIPFRKGYAPLYKVTLKNGLSFTATAKHRVLASRGWVFVGSLQTSELLLGCVESRLLSNLVASPLVSWQDAQSYAETPRDCQGDYSACSRQCDALPQTATGSALAFAPSLADALERNHVGHAVDDHETSQEHSRLCRLSSLPSSVRSLRPGQTQETAHEEYCAYQYIPLRDDDLSLPAYQSQLETRRQIPTSSKDYHFVHTRSYDYSPYSNYTVFSSTVSNIEYARDDYYYDLTVPEAGHYLANGIWHHNTGKTYAACWKTHLICSKYPGAQGAILRKTQASIYGSVLQTFARVIDGAPVEPYGGQKPEKYIYQNGSVVWIGGMDNRDRVLSSERDFVQTCQTEEFTVDDWEYLTTRTTGRGAIIPHPQLYGDCNPAGSLHWIRERNKAGHLRLIHTTHRDNPTLCNRDGSLTMQGERTMSRLSALSGVRRKRLFEGIWATAEGAVYDNFDSSIHVKVRAKSEFKIFYLAMDEGYTNPAVILVVGEDSDGRLHICREYYERGKLQSTVVQQAKEWALEYGVQLAAVDEAAAGLIADLVNSNIPARAAKGRVLDGIQSIQDRLKVQDDGLPRLTVDPGCVNTVNEFESYVWKKVTNTGIVKDEPNKENDHALDAIRYLDDLIKIPQWYMI